MKTMATLGYRRLRLILGDQLNPLHSWWQQRDAETLYVMMEVRQETDYVLHHAQKILAIFAAMREFARQVQQAGHALHYYQISDPHNQHQIVANLQQLIARYAISEFEWQDPDEWRLDRYLHEAAALFRQQGIACRAVDSEHFLTERGDVAAVFAGKQRWTMEVFYRGMRQRYQILLEQGKPVGGKWNYDHENRQAWPGQPAVNADQRPSHDHSVLWQEIVAAGVASFGEPSAQALRWPLNRREARAQLQDFIEHGLCHFGQYQDAMHSQEWRLFHSLLSFAINCKMLHPLEVIQQAQQAWREGRVEIAAAEGFIRQILGWREYVRGVYWTEMPAYGGQNYFQHQLDLPEWFWHGRTGMRCLALALQQSLQHAHAHHIQRLMVIGNFALLAGLNPQQLHRWYLGIYIDAFEWVELPNTLGMSQFADGGKLATKPYVSSAAYINKMSDYCEGCGYQKKLKTEANACPFNALYWDFHLRHQDRLKGNPRLGIVYQQLQKMPEAQKQALQQRAIWLKQHMNEL